MNGIRGYGANVKNRKEFRQLLRKDDTLLIDHLRLYFADALTLIFGQNKLE
jgi:hypothetical protein